MVYTCPKRSGRRWTIPWQEASVVSLRYEFVRLAEREGANIRELCRRFTISPPTAYKWLSRYAQEGAAGLADRSRRPRGYPAGPRRLGSSRPSSGSARSIPLGEAAPYARCCSRRPGAQPEHHHGDPAPARPHRHCRTCPARLATVRASSDLWQMDFKGHFPTGAGRCHPLTIVDDQRFARPSGMRRRAHPDGAGTAARHLPCLWPARTPAHGQRLPLGQRCRPPAHPPHRLAPAPRHPGEPRAPVPSAGRRGSASTGR